MQIKCDQCGFTSDGPDGFAGKKLKCPKCGVEFVVGGESAFKVVEDNPAASQYKKSIVEKSIGKIGSLEVTNKRVQGVIEREIPAGNGVRVEKTNIDVLLNLVTGITVDHVNLKGTRIFGSVLLALAIGLLPVGIALIVQECEFLGCVVVMPVEILCILLGIVFVLKKDRIRLVLSISGVNHVIPFKTSQKQEAEEKCKMLKNAKSEYERIACI